VSENFRVRSIFREYEVHFEDDFAARLATQLHKGDVIVVDEIVNDLYANRLDRFLVDTIYVVIRATEEQKSYDQLNRVLESLIEKGFRKNHRLIAIGGGITQDVTGFIASILYRGVEWMYYPTTLLAQCDSCIGSKTSINFGKYKNQVGTFYPPSEVIIDLNFLNTLPKDAILSGLGEMIHYFLVSSEADFRRMKAEYAKSLKDRNTLKSLLARSLEIKRALVEVDEFDRKERQVFNYGHSFGHAIESATDYAIPHGIAVSFGMDIANFLSSRLGYISEDLRQDIRELLAWNWGSTDLRRMALPDFVATLQKDKKNIGADVNVILTRGPGRMFKTKLALDATTMEWLHNWFEAQSQR